MLKILSVFFGKRFKQIATLDFKLDLAEKTAGFLWAVKDVQEHVPAVYHLHSKSLEKEAPNNILEICISYSFNGYLVLDPEDHQAKRMIILWPAKHNGTEDIDMLFRTIREKSKEIALWEFKKKELWIDRIPANHNCENEVEFEYNK